MAKKKRRIVEEKEEEYVFTPSVFDEREFILKDIYGTKVLFVIIGLAILTGIVGSLLYRMMPSTDSEIGMGFYAGFLLSLVIVLVMKKLLMLMKFRVDLLETKTMLVNYLIFLMLGLGVCIVLINAPFL